MKITSKTALKSIISTVFEDFNVTIDERDAHAIRDAHRAGALLWTSTKLVITASASHISQITRGRIRACNGAVYTAREWANL